MIYIFSSKNDFFCYRRATINWSWIIHLYFYSKALINVLLGVDFYQYVVEEQQSWAFVATLTSLGWLLLCSSANTNDVYNHISNHSSIESCNIDFQELDTNVKEKEFGSVVTGVSDPQIALVPEQLSQEANAPVQGEELDSQITFLL